jgi:hypothetical protein
MKTRLLVVTPGTHNTQLNAGYLLDYLHPFNTQDTPDPTEYTWDARVAHLHAGDTELNVTVDALDIQFLPELPYLKGDLHVLLMYPKDQLPLYDVQLRIIEIATQYRVKPVEGVMHLPSEWDGFDLQGYSFTVPELTTYKNSLPIWLFDDADNAPL